MNSYCAKKLILNLATVQSNAQDQTGTEKQAKHLGLSKDINEGRKV